MLTHLAPNVQSGPQAAADTLTHDHEGVKSLRDAYGAPDGRAQEAVSTQALILFAHIFSL